MKCVYTTTQALSFIFSASLVLCAAVSSFAVLRTGQAAEYLGLHSHRHQMVSDIRDGGALARAIEHTRAKPRTVYESVEVRSGYLYRGSKRFVIAEANSPENRLRFWDEDPEFALWELDYLASLGINTIYYTIYGGDDTSIRLTAANFSHYRAYAEEIAARGMVSHVLLGEEENHHLLSDSERAAMFDLALEMYHDLPSILCLGEEITQQVGYPYVRKWCEYLRDKSIERYGRPPVVSLHNQRHWRPWDRFVNDGSDRLFQLIAFQATPAQYSELVQWHSTFASAGNPVAVYMSENVNVAKQDLSGGVDDALNWMWQAWPATSGAGLYTGYADPRCNDLSCREPWLYEQSYRALAESADMMARGASPEEASLLIGAVIPFVRDPSGVQDVSYLIRK